MYIHNKKEMPMTSEEMRIWGRVYGILAAIKELSDTEINAISFRPMESLKNAIALRASKMTPEDHEKITGLLAFVSQEDTGPNKEEDTGPFWLAFHKQLSAGRPPKYGDPMVIRAVRVPENLWKQASERAEANNKTLSDIIRNALENYIK